MKKTNKIPTIIGIIVLLAGLAAGILLIGNQQVFKLGATAEVTPKNVRVTNLSDNSFTVSWLTEKEALGFVKWGETQGSLTNIVEDEIGKASLTHTATVRGIKSETKHFFEINSRNTNFDNNGAAWQATTGKKLSTPQSHNMISGVILAGNGAPAQNALVYVIVGGSSPLSTTTSNNGTWLIPLSSAKVQSLLTYVDINDTNTPIEISTHTSINQSGSAQIYLQSAKPVPAIQIGKTHDFRSLPPSGNNDLPQFSLDLPETTVGAEDQKSGFTIPDNETDPDTSTLTLESVDEGEVISTSDPEFFGEGPPGAELTITIESDPMTDTLTVGSGGNWNWSPPEGLEEGIHKITVSWKDASGILRRLTRTFIVQASEGPAFVSTPSASPNPTGSPTPSPISTPTPTITAAPTVTPAPTEVALPDAGSLTPTMILTIMGLGLISFGLLLSVFEKVKQPV